MKLTKEEGELLDSSWELMHRFVSLFKMAGFKHAFPRAIPDKKDVWGHDWFMMATEYGDIEIGWRKRVISIDGAGADMPERNIIQFFHDDVTKEETLIHAWGYEKCLEYLGRLEHILMLNPQGFKSTLATHNEYWAKQDAKSKEEVASGQGA